jgi:hypothetical protein
MRIGLFGDEEVVKAKFTAFMAEYEALCRRHGLLVNSCGCCNSQWVETFTEARWAVAKEEMEDWCDEDVARQQDPKEDN